MTALLSPLARQQFRNPDTDEVAANARLYTYATGTTTPLATYKDRNRTAAHTNPIILDARGMPADSGLYLASDQVYDFSFQSPTGDILWTQAGVSANGGDAAGIRFTQTGTASAIRTVLDKLHELPSVMDKIPVTEHAAIYARTSTYDCTTAIQAAVNDYPRCTAPAGTFLVTGAITLPTGHELIGAGSHASIFSRAGSVQSYFVMGTNSALSGIGFKRSGSVTATTGRLIDVGISGVRIADVYSDHCWNGIYVTSCAGLFLDRIYLNGWQDAALNINGNTNDVLLTNFIFTSGATGAGIKLYDKVEAFAAVNGDVIGGQYGMTTGAAAATFDPHGNRAFPQFNKFSNVYFDSSVNGVVLEKSNLTTFSNCWFSSSSAGNGVTVGLCYTTTFQNCDAVTNAGSGFRLSNTGQKHTKLLGCNAVNNDVANAGQNGIVVDAGVSDFIIEGCSGYNSGATGQDYGLYIAPGGSDRYAVIGNNFAGNVAGPISDNGTGVSKRLSGNIGYLPPVLAPTFLNTWSNLGAPTETVGYWKDADNMVHLRGLATGGTIGAAIFNLPAGFRPAANETFAVSSNNAFGSCQITAAGDVNAVAGSNVWFSLCGIRFRAA